VLDLATVRKLGLMAVVTVTLSLAACTGSSTSPDHHSATGLIAWTPTPAPPTTSSTTTTTTLAPAPLCTKADLHIGPSFTGGATGHIGVSFRLTNIGKITCRLRGYPVLFAITQAGSRVVVPVHHGTFFIDAVPGNLTRKTSGYFVIVSSDFCLGVPPGSVGGLYPLHYRKLVIDLPDGASVVTGAKIFACGPLEVSQVGVQPPIPGQLPAPQPGAVSFLDVRVAYPARIAGDSVLDYVVYLSNRGSSAVVLSPCPAYTESLGIPPRTAVRRLYELNCRAVGQIGPHKSVGFEMEMPVPKVSKLVQAKFIWSLDTSYQQAGGGLHEVYP
jgi:hypothetical protein